jgi:hypothetical protein
MLLPSLDRLTWATLEKPSLMTVALRPPVHEALLALWITDNPSTDAM